MKKMMAMLLASVMVAGTFATTAFAYTGDDVQKNTSCLLYTSPSPRDTR